MSNQRQPGAYVETEAGAIVPDLTDPAMKERTPAEPPAKGAKKEPADV